MCFEAFWRRGLKDLVTFGLPETTLLIGMWDMIVLAVIVLAVLVLVMLVLAMRVLAVLVLDAIVLAV